ncbi:MAG: FxLYD domain-containing protein [Gemmatimonadaceae bacterium]
MNALRNAAACSLALLAVMPAVATAQESECKIDYENPGEVKNAYRALAVLQLSRPEDAKRQLQGVVKNLTERPERIRNQAGRNAVLGQALVMWVDRGATYVSPRGELGYTTQPQATIDVLAAADSAFDAVEQAMPECKTETGNSRRRAWGTLVNQAGELINRDQLDSAEMLITRAHSIFSDSPYGYYYLAGIHQRKDNHPGTIEALRKTLALATPQLAAEDTNVKEVREYARYTIGSTLLRQAESAQGDQKKQFMTQAVEAFREYLKEYPQGPNASRAQQGLMLALDGSGDSTAVAAMRREMITNATQFTDLQLLEAGTDAFNAGRYDEAASLLEKSLEKNSHYVQTLYTLGTTYGIQKKYDKMLPVVRRLVSVAPNSSENLELLALALDGTSRAMTNARERRVLADSVNYYADRAQQLPVKVAFNRFIHEGVKHTLGGTVENTAAAPKNVPLKVEFLDSQGRVVGTKENQVSVPAKGKAEFTIEIEGDGVAAFRYAPIT